MDFGLLQLRTRFFFNVGYGKSVYLFFKAMLTYTSKDEMLQIPEGKMAGEKKYFLCVFSNSRPVYQLKPKRVHMHNTYQNKNLQEWLPYLALFSMYTEQTLKIHM